MSCCFIENFSIFQFGLRKFYDEHEEVIKQIKKRRDKCIAELAELENEIIPDDAKHFAKLSTAEVCYD